MEKGKLLYFTVFIFVVIAFIFHVNAMGHHHWKKAIPKNVTSVIGFSRTTIGLFTRCVRSDTDDSESCYPNLYPRNNNCNYTACDLIPRNETCQCDYLPSTKGIAACTIIAAVFLGLVILILFIYSIKNSNSRPAAFFLAFFPLILLLLSFIFILIALILVGSYLSRDMMFYLRNPFNDDLNILRQAAQATFDIRVDWSTGLEIIALFFSFVSFILYSIFVFVINRSS